MQWLRDVEILVVDDASTDETWDCLQAMKQDDPLLTPIRGAGNGPSAARNTALSLVCTPLVAFLDVDDFWWPSKLSRQLEFHEAHPEIAFSFTDYLHVDLRGEVRGTCFDYWRPRFIDRKKLGFSTIRDAELELLAINVVGTSTVVAFTEALQNANGFVTDWRSAEDWHLWLRLAAAGPVAVNPAVTTSYLMHSASVTRARSARTLAMRAIVDQYKDRTEPAARRALRVAKSRIATAEAEHARELGDSWSAIKGNMAAFVNWPRRRTARALAADLIDAMPISYPKNTRLAPEPENPLG